MAGDELQAKPLYPDQMGLIHGTAQLSNPTRPELQGWRCVPYMVYCCGPYIPVSLADRRRRLWLS